MKRLMFIGLIVMLVAMAAGTVHAQAYKMLAPSNNQQLFFGSTQLTAGSVSVSVLAAGTVTAAVASLSSEFATGTDTPWIGITKSGGSITLQLYNHAGADTTGSPTVFYIGAGSQ